MGPASKRAEPKGSAIPRLSGVDLQLHAREQVVQTIAPPVDHKPIRWLLLVGQQLDERTILLRGGRLN
jgi:hypothetical protein